MQIPQIPSTPDLDGIWRLLCWVISSVAGLLLFSIKVLWCQLNTKSADLRIIVETKDLEIVRLNQELRKQAEDHAEKAETLLREVLTAIRSSKRPDSGNGTPTPH